MSAKQIGGNPPISTQSGKRKLAGPEDQDRLIWPNAVNSILRQSW